jgi:hypothetical protein
MKRQFRDWDKLYASINKLISRLQLLHKKEREDKRRELLAPALDEFFAWVFLFSNTPAGADASSYYTV